MELFLVLSNAHFVGGPEMFVNHISIAMDTFEALFTLVKSNDIAAVVGEAFHISLMTVLPVLIEGIFVRKDGRLTLFILRAVEFTAVVPRVRGGLSNRGGRLPL